MMHGGKLPLARARGDCRRGSVLILVLWLLIILGVAGLGYTSSVRTQQQATYASRERREAYWAARAGIELATATLANLTEEEKRQLQEDDLVFNDEEQFKDVEVGSARVSLVLAPPPGEDDDGPRFGLLDEGSRINVNKADREMLMALDGMTEDLADSLIDWRDEDHEPQPFGAELDYYLSLADDYPPRNGLLQSVRELLRVRGWAEVFEAAYPDPYQRFARAEGGGAPRTAREGGAANRSTSESGDGAAEYEPVEAADLEPAQARELLECLTAWSAGDNLAPDGEAKLAINEAKAEEMEKRVTGAGSDRKLKHDEAIAIIAHRNKKQFEAVTGLFDVMQPTEQEKQQAEGKGGQNNAAGGDNKSGENKSGEGNAGSGEQKKQFDFKRVGEIIDFFAMEASGNAGAATGGGGIAESGATGGTGGEDPSMGLINVNTAPRAVLEAVPGMTEEVAGAIIDRRRAEGAYAGPGGVASVDGMNEEMFKKLYPWLTAHTRRFRATAVGATAGGARATIEVVLSLEGGALDPQVKVLYWREY